MELQKPINVRLSAPVRKKVERIKNQTGISMSALVRLAIEAGLPLVAQQVAKQLRASR